ncbi:TPA: hypothetical protein DEO28_03195 [Candidatus Dependentiae bacterium]|nr:MAG: hypothetical protein UR14_C0005G0012 [candidate division TM6 bacterium GW2011_GWE2_31_21]KKP53088.1 MAG: hypothetical protein UR43_C0007G0012 [candidate division TM6 bacterium GW2011_GWF2_33_332]HBS47906.1 hypothetical protein [Candidatus Dependentiae bacterium]HBZ73490.1 hypothetical protein [Candidatus Dependentiae bacterium]
MKKYFKLLTFLFFSILGESNLLGVHHAIFDAIKAGNLEFVRFLVSLNPSCIDEKDEKFFLPLQRACERVDLFTIAEFLLEKGSIITSSVLFACNKPIRELNETIGYYEKSPGVLDPESPDARIACDIKMTELRQKLISWQRLSSNVKYQLHQAGELDGYY